MRTFLDAFKDGFAAGTETPGTLRVIDASTAATDDFVLAVARQNGNRLLCIAARDAEAIPADFEYLDETAGGGLITRSGPLSHVNAALLRRVLPWTAPVSLRDRRTTFGCGDRLGRATGGHLQALRSFRAAPVLAQQSIRELTLTGRTFQNVVDDVTFLVFQQGYTDGYGADGDHLKTLSDINTAVDAGMTMITLDLSDVMLADAEHWAADRVRDAFAALPAATREHVLETYSARSFPVQGGSVTLTRLETQRCALMYVKALDFAAEVNELLQRRRAHAYDLEISIDETTAPTLPAHHLFIIRELHERGVHVNSLAPRFIGEFQKGIDYIGDLAEFEAQFQVHAAIARSFGDYKISIHSGSDKFSVYPIIGRHTAQRVHVKTAGTSWLEALRTVAQCDPELFRELHQRALDTFSEALRHYHVTPDLAAIPAPPAPADSDLPKLLDNDAARQLLHVTYGGILEHEALAPRLFACLDACEADYERHLERHFARHLGLLGIERRAGADGEVDYKRGRPG